MTDRPDPRVTRTRDAVTSTALDLLMTAGWSAVTHATVAERSGYSRMTVYNHWPTRTDLLRAAFERVAEYPRPPRSGDLATDVAAELRAYRDVLHAGFDRLHTGLAENAHDDEEIAELRHQVSELGIAPLRRLLHDAEVASPVLIADALAGVVTHRVVIRGGDLGDDDIEAIVDLLLA